MLEICVCPLYIPICIKVYLHIIPVHIGLQPFLSIHCSLTLTWYLEPVSRDRVYLAPSFARSSVRQRCCAHPRGHCHARPSAIIAALVFHGSRCCARPRGHRSHHHARLAPAAGRGSATVYGPAAVRSLADGHGSLASGHCPAAARRALLRELVLCFAPVG